MTGPNTEKAQGFTNEDADAGRVGNLCRVTHLVVVDVGFNAGSLAPVPLMELTTVIYYPDSLCSFGCDCTLCP